MPGRNDLCFCGSGKKYKKCCLQSENDISPNFDIRHMERVTSQIQSTLARMDFDNIKDVTAALDEMDLNNIDCSNELQESSPLSQAQNLIYDAWDSTNPDDRVRLAQQALSLSRDCADAHLILADEEENNDARIAIVREAFEAGKRALGEKYFADDVGNFWGILETRPYMRAKLELADCLWLKGESYESLGHLWEMLELNPNDNQGVRHILMSRLLAKGDTESTKILFENYPDDCSVEWDFSDILIKFKSGNKGQAKKLLKNATKRNPHVVDFLLGQRKMPEYLPSSYSIGSKDEAIIYVAEAAEAWLKNPAAIKWMASQYRNAR